MPMYKLYNEMPYSELLLWQEYFECNPPEWRADYRASIIAGSMGAKHPEKAFASLKAVGKRKNKDDNGLKGSAIFQQMLSAKGGDKLDFLQG